MRIQKALNLPLRLCLAPGNGELIMRRHNPRSRSTVFRHYLWDAPIPAVLLLEVRILWCKQIGWCLGCQFHPFGAFEVMLRKPVIFLLPVAPQVSAIDLGRPRLSRLLNKESDGNTLLNIEHILVISAVRCPLTPPGITMKIKDIDPTKCLH